MEDPLTSYSPPASRKRTWLALVLAPLFVLLTLAVVWLYCEVGRIDYPAREWNLATLASRVDGAQKNISVLDSRVAANEGALRSLDAAVSATEIDVGNLASYVDSVAAVANNANMYAHSHTYSDLRLKQDLAPLSDALTKVLSLNGIYFRWNTQDFAGLQLEKGRQVGLIAQEVEQLYPELVYTDLAGFKSIDYARLTPVLIEAVKQQQAQIDNLAKQNESLEARILALEELLNQAP